MVEAAFSSGKPPMAEESNRPTAASQFKPFEQSLSVVSHDDQIRVESEALFSGVASTSHAMFGNFIVSNDQARSEQIALLRSMNTIELYQRDATDQASLELVSTYKMPNVRVLSMEKLTIDVRQSVFEASSQIVTKKRFKKQGAEFVLLEEDDEVIGTSATAVGVGAATANVTDRLSAGVDLEDEDDDYLDVRTKDILVVHLPELKFLLLEFDQSVSEFGTYCLFNFDHCDELKVTGKRFPNQGFLRSVSATSVPMNGFGFLADDTIFCWVQLQEIQEVIQATANQGAKTGRTHSKVSKQTQQSAAGGHAKKPAMQLEISKRQSSQIWTEYKDADEQMTQGVLASITLNEKYMNAMSGDPTRVTIEQLVKPLELFHLDKYDIQFIVDLQLIEQRASQNVMLIVLYKGDISQIVGTKARYPISRLAIFQLQANTSSEPPVLTEQIRLDAGALQADPWQSNVLKEVVTIKALPFYANRILKSASPADDYCYLVTPYSICLVRLESNRVTEIYTSTLGLTLKEKYQNDKNKMFYPEETIGTERTELDNYASKELKLDGTSRLMSLPNHRILLLTENGSFTMMTIRFDQAEIDVAEAIFSPLKQDEKITASAICYVPSRQNEQTDFDIFVSSHFHDATLYKLSTVKDPEKILQLETELEDSEKRQRLNSGGQEFMIGANPNFIRRKFLQTHYERLQVLDTIPTLSPITDACQIPSIAGTELKGPTETQFSMDFLIGSGNQVKSYLTFAAASVPLAEQEMKMSQLIPAEDVGDPNLQVLRVMNCEDHHILVNYTTCQASGVKTSAIQIDAQSKKLVQVREDMLKLKFDTETLACYSLPEKKIVQVYPSGVRVVTIEEPSQVLHETSHDGIEQTCMDKQSQILFILVRNSDGMQTIKAMAANQLTEIFQEELNRIQETVCAMSVTPVIDKPSLLILATEAGGLKNGEIFIYEIRKSEQEGLRSHLKLVYKCSQVADQLPILPNQIRVEHSSLLQRSMTDLSVDINNSTACSNYTENVNNQASDQRMFASAQMLSEQEATNSVREIKLWFSEPQPASPYLILILADFSVLLYRSFSSFDELSKERFRFKMIDSHTLIKPRISLSAREKFSRQHIYVEDKMAFILHPSRPFGIFIRNGKSICIDIGKQQGSSFVSMAPFMTGYLGLKKVESSVKIVMFKFPPRFDPRTPSIKLTDGYLMKQFMLADKGIKKLKIFSPNVASLGQTQTPTDRDYIFVATYKHITPAQGLVADFAPETRSPSIKYTLEALKMPRFNIPYHEFDETFLIDQAIRQDFPDNQVINQLEQITLRSTQDDFRNYLAVASIKIDTSLQHKKNPHTMRSDDEGFYSSALSIFQVESAENRFRTCFVENYKRSITCISSYLGNLIATLKDCKLQDLVFVMYKFNEQFQKLEQPQPIPNGVQNLATSISFDGDFIIIGDAYKNLNLLKKCDEEDNKMERQESSGLINFKKVMSNKIEANVIGAYSLNKKLSMRTCDQAVYCQNGIMSYQQIVPLTEIQKKMFTVLAASLDGYLRLYKIKESKNLEIVAQINVMDKILSTIPLELNQIRSASTATKREEDHEADKVFEDQQLISEIQNRKLAIVTQRNGILLTSACTELEFRAQRSLIEYISRALPHRGCLTPMHSHLTPLTTYPEKSSVFQRMNSNSVNYSKSLYLYFFLTQTQKRNIASKIGFTVAKLEAFLISQRQYGHSKPVVNSLRYQSFADF